MNLLGVISILAEKIDTTRILILVAVVIFSIVSSLIKKALKNAQEASSKSPAPPPVPRTPMPTQSQSPQAIRTESPGRRQRMEQPALPTKRRQVYNVPQTAATRPSISSLGDEVDEEVLRQQRHLEEKQAQRDQRLAARMPSEADTSAIEARLLHIRKADVAVMEVEREIEVDLTELDQLTMAVVYAEVLSPPVAIRQAPPLWEM
jgi:uncharacterized membrane protein